MYTTAFLARSSTYDLVWMDVVWTAKMAAAGWLVPLDRWTDPAQLAGHFKGAVDAGKYKEKLYRMPVTFDSGVLYYRKDLLAERGKKPPATWEELVSLAKALQSPPDRWGVVFQGKQYEGLVCNVLEWVWSGGGDFLASNGEVVIDRPEAVRAFQEMVDLVRLHQVAPPAVTTYEEEDTRLLFQHGHAVFMRNWPYAWTLLQREDSPVKGKVGMVPMVHRAGAYESAATLGGWGLGISTFSPHPEAAWSFIAFVSSSDIQKLLHQRTGIQPSWKELYRDPEILKGAPSYRELFQVFEKARPRPSHPRYPQCSDLLAVQASRALAGEISAKTALETAAREIRRVMGSVP